MFDTLQATKNLKDAGLESNAAEAIVMAFGTIAENMVSRRDMQGLTQGLATTEDLEGFATKEDLRDFATKEDLQAFRDYLSDHYATKADLIAAVSGLSERVERGFAEMHKHIWHVGIGIIGVNILMTTAIITAAKYLL